MNRKQIREAAQEMPANVLGAGRQVWLAGLGAAGIVANGGQAVFTMLVEEGKRVKGLDVGHMVDMVEDVVDSAVVPVKKTLKQMDRSVLRTSKNVLSRLGVPTQQEVEGLTDRVEQLITKVESMNQRRKARKGGRRAH